MNILLIGSNGREHALAWKLLQSDRVTQLFISADTGAIEALGREYPGRVHAFQWHESDKQALVQFALQQTIELVIIGPEAPLAAGVSDTFRLANIPVFGPSQAAARIESSKAFAKAFMKRHQIPTAQYEIFTDHKTACHYVEKCGHPVVIKVSGLAAGKGVFLPKNLEEALQILTLCLVEKRFGEAGKEIVIEERLEGPELSLLCFTDGSTVRVMPPARDYKRLLDQNQGPNTGGMGVYAPVVLPQSVSIAHLVQIALQPAVDGLCSEGTPFQGVLYAGFILTQQGPKVLEFNARFGDPETQVLMPLLQSDLLEIVEACTMNPLRTQDSARNRGETPDENKRGNLASLDIQWKSQQAICVVLASEGYPENKPNPVIIQEWEHNDPETWLFHAGTRYQSGQLHAAGGRVLNVVALGNTHQEARQRAYNRISQLHFPGGQYRLDIGQ